MVRVAAAVLLRGDGAVLLAQRPAGKAYAGYWEFPGGKLEAGETSRQALARELREELGIEVRHAAPWLIQEFVYPHAHVELHFFRVFSWEGQLVGHDGQAFAWQTPGRYTVTPLLPANTRILAALALPAIYGITCAGDLGEDEFLARARRALARGLRLIQLREKDWPIARRDQFARQLVPLAQCAGARVLLNGTEDDARRLGCDGVHWTSAALAAASKLSNEWPNERSNKRPTDMLVAASCHTQHDLARAGELDLDFAVLGPVGPTPSHPEALLLGWEGFAATVAGTRVPTYALGGLAAADVARAINCGAQGVALRRAAWPLP